MLFLGAAAPPKYALVSQVPWTNAGDYVRPLTNSTAIYAPGAQNVGFQPANDGTTVKLLWVPGKAAFRAGESDTGTNWDYGSLGFASTAFGSETMAFGTGAFAVGQQNESRGIWSFSGGQGSLASNVNSFAFGAQTIALGDGAFALGQHSVAGGRSSFACCADGFALGNFSFVANDANVASGVSSSAFGFTTIALGENSFVAGDSCIATNYANFALGAENTTGADYAFAFGRRINNTTRGSVEIGTNTLKTRFSAAGVTMFGGLNLTVSGRVQATNGYASFSSIATNQIPTTGWTNNEAVNVTVYTTATAVSFTINNGAGTVLYTSPTLTATVPVNLQPGWSVRAASGLTGTVLPF